MAQAGQALLLVGAVSVLAAGAVLAQVAARPDPTDGDSARQEATSQGDSDHALFWADAGRFWSETGWSNGYRAFALMPEGWKADPWLPAQGFFTVGRAFPVDALSWQGQAGLYDAEQALGEGRLGRTMLGAVGQTQLWGADEGFIERDWRRLVLKADVCVNEPGALLASPFWSVDRGIKRFPVLVGCGGAAQKGLELYAHAALWDDATWEASGVSIEDVIPRLRDLEQFGLELVCVTPELARERRRERRQRSVP